MRIITIIIDILDKEDETLVSDNDSKKRKFTVLKNSELRVKLLSTKAIKPKKVANGYEIYRCVIKKQQTR